MMTRYMLGALLCIGLAGEARATTVTTIDASLDWSGVAFTFGPGTEEWKIENLVTQRFTGVLVDTQGRRQFSGEGASSHSSLTKTDERGTQSAVADSTTSLITGSTTADMDPSLAHARLGASPGVNTQFFVSGEGPGTLTLSVPYTLHLMRDAVVPAIHGDGEYARASLSLGANGLRGSGASDLLRWDQSSLELTKHGIFTVSLDFLNPVRTPVILVGSVDAHDVAAGVPEPSTWLLMGLGLVGLVFWKKRAVS